jgi:hypothetical protein
MKAQRTLTRSPQTTARVWKNPNLDFSNFPKTRLKPIDNNERLWHNSTVVDTKHKPLRTVPLKGSFLKNGKFRGSSFSQDRITLWLVMLKYRRDVREIDPLVGNTLTIEEWKAEQ